MKSRSWIYLSVLLLLLLAFVFSFRRGQHESGYEPERQSIKSSKSALESTNLEIQNPSASNQAASAPDERGTSSTAQDNLQKGLEKFKQALEEKNVPFDFYGRVIDQDSNSLSGVKIKLVVRHWGMTSSDASSSIRLEQETDAKGCFHINGVTGDAFDMENIEKEGYELEPTKRSYGAVGGSFSDPVVFKMWQNTIKESLITGDKRFVLIPDGRSFIIDLFKGTITESDQSEGDLRVRIKRPQDIVFGRRYDWSCKIEIVNGGLLPEVDANSAMYLAPTENYTPSFHAEHRTSENGWGDSTGTKRFYLKLRNGQMYGRVSLEISAYYNNQVPSRIRIQYALNPSGSRILR